MSDELYSCRQNNGNIKGKNMEKKNWCFKLQDFDPTFLPFPEEFVEQTLQLPLQCYKQQGREDWN